MANANLEIANTILAQIGAKALYLLGAKDKIAIENGVQFKIRGSRKANVVRITLDPSDTYTIEISKYSPARFNAKKGTFSESKNRIVESVSDAYAEDLRKIIESATGLYTSL